MSKGNGETTTVVMPPLVQAIGAREAAAMAGRLGALLYWALRAEAIFIEVATAWASGRRHPFALPGIVESKILVGTGRKPGTTVLAGAALPSEIIVGMRGAIEEIRTSLERLRISWRDKPNEDVLERRIRERIAGAVVDFAAHLSAKRFDTESGSLEVGATSDSAALIEELTAWAVEAELNLDGAAVDNWTSFWPPKTAPEPEPAKVTAFDRLSELWELAEDVRRMAPPRRTVEDLGNGMIRRTVVLGADGSLPPPEPPDPDLPLPGGPVDLGLERS